MFVCWCMRLQASSRLGGAQRYRVRVASVTQNVARHPAPDHLTPLEAPTMRVLTLLMILATGSAFAPSAHKLTSSVRTRAPVSAISMSADSEVSSHRQHRRARIPRPPGLGRARGSAVHPGTDRGTAVYAALPPARPPPPATTTQPPLPLPPTADRRPPTTATTTTTRA